MRVLYLEVARDRGRVVRMAAVMEAGGRYEFREWREDGSSTSLAVRELAAELFAEDEEGIVIALEDAKAGIRITIVSIPGSAEKAGEYYVYREPGFLGFAEYQVWVHEALVLMARARGVFG